jgi:hypothetical protein
MSYISSVESRGGAGGAPLYQLKISLKYSKPLIWRRVIAPSDLALESLHAIIQVAMPWTNSHLHQFILGRTFYILDRESMEMPFGAGPEMLNEEDYTIKDLAPAAKKKFLYEYDFGDSWMHEILVEKVLPPDPKLKHIVCLAGAMACPPDDCGSLPGYYNLLEALANPKHQEHEELSEWIGVKWNPDYFPLDEINKALKKFKV